MKWLLLFCILSNANALEAVRDPPSYDPTKLLLNVRKKVVATVNRLPSYMCRETVDRSMFLPTVSVTNVPRTGKCDCWASLRKEPTWKTRRTLSDRLAFDVAVSKEGEMYSLVGENRFRADNPASLFGTGLTSTGAFGIFLNNIFASDAASFSYNGDIDFQGRTLAEFAYSVPLENGGYYIEAKGQGQKFSAVVPYDGTFLVDPQTFDLVRLTVRAAQLPKELKICEATTTLEYANVRMNTSEFLLPINARLHVNNDDGTESENKMTFSGCHEFGSESTLRFDPPAASRPVPGLKHPSEPPSLPAEQQKQLLAIRANVMTTVDRLPKYLCTETIDHSKFLPKTLLTKGSCDELESRRKIPGWTVRESGSDRLRLDVAVSSSEGEMYSWVAKTDFMTATWQIWSEVALLQPARSPLRSLQSSEATPPLLPITAKEASMVARSSNSVFAFRLTKVPLRLETGNTARPSPIAAYF